MGLFTAVASYEQVIRDLSSPERVKHFETRAHRIYCCASRVSVVGSGALIHTAVGRAGGVGGLCTKRSGWAP